MNSHVSSITPERQRRREQERLPPLGLGQPPQDEAQVGDEPHVEHAVGLVDHQHLDACRRPDVLLEVVDEPARRADEQVAAARAGPRAAWRSRCRRRRSRMRSPVWAPSRLASASICTTSSRVGAMISTRGRSGRSAAARRGAGSGVKAAIRNAAVLPVPVCDWPATSRALERQRQRRLLDRRGSREPGVADAREHGLGQSSEVNSNGLMPHPPARRSPRPPAPSSPSGRRSTPRRSRPRRAGRAAPPSAPGSRCPASG